MQRASGRNVRHGCKECGAYETCQRPIWSLQAGIKLFESLTLTCKKAVEVESFPWKMLLDLSLHFFRLRACKHSVTCEAERVHRIQLAESKIIIGRAAAFCEKFVEEKFHHQKRWAQVETILP